MSVLVFLHRISVSEKVYHLQREAVNAWFILGTDLWGSVAPMVFKLLRVPNCAVCLAGEDKGTGPEASSAVSIALRLLTASISLPEGRGENTTTPPEAGKPLKNIDTSL